MVNNPVAAGNAATFWRLTVGVLVLAPFLAVSLYDHPQVDDFWCTTLVKNYGFWNAQIRLYDIVPPRYLGLALSSLGPLSFGNVSGYKIIPMLFILLITGLLTASFRTLSDKKMNRGETFVLGLFFTGLYLSVLPGIAEGIYWASALSVYHTGIVLFILWVNCLLKYYYGKRSPYYFAAACGCLFGIFGCNEIISSIALIILAVILWHKLRNKTAFSDTFLLIQLILSAGCLFFVLRYKGIGNRFTLVHGEGSGRLLYSAGYALLTDGYYICRCLINPFFWAIVIAGYGPFRRFAGWFYSAYRPLFNYRRSFFAGWLFVLVLIPFMIFFVTGERPPLRICNIIVFYFLYGGMGVAVYGFQRWARPLPALGKYRAGAVVLLLIAGFMLKNNVSLVTGDLYYGYCARYDREWNQRYELIRECKSDSCVVPALTRIPFAFWFSPDGADFRISEYFGKQIIVRQKDH
jgi:hypothetical protein